jgi:ABC-2 type transport system permease protein
LREVVGVEPVNRALRNLLSKFPAGRTPYPTSLDFYNELRATTPPPMHGLLKDLFEEVTFWELSAKRIDVKPDGNGAHRITLHVDARKMKGDATGTERPVPMNDPVEILVHDANGKPLHRATYRIRSGAQTIELTVPRPPSGHSRPRSRTARPAARRQCGNRGKRRLALNSSRNPLRRHY